MSFGVKQVAHLTPPLQRDLIDLFARVFGPGHSYSYIFQDEATRLEHTRWALGCKFRMQRRRWVVHITEGALDGYAIWFPPTRRPVFTPLEQAMAGYMAAPFVVGPAAFARMAVYGAHERALLQDALSEPHWVLDSLAVEEPARGRGLGAALIAPVLARADEHGHPIYVMTHNPRALDFYHQHDFQIIQERRAAPDANMGYSLRRRPR